MVKWIVTKKTIKGNGERTLRYESEHTPVVVESRKRAVEHANRSGYWFRTSFFAIYPDGTEKECWSLYNAKAVAEHGELK